MDLTEPRASGDTSAARLYGQSLALRRLQLLDAPPQEAFDRLTRLVSRLLDVPLALLSMVEGDRQYLLSQVGLGEPWASAREMPLAHAFREPLGTGQGPLVVCDARAEDRAAPEGSSAQLGAVAYVAVPIFYAEQCAGALCAVDLKPREWSEAELAALDDVAALASAELERRGAALERDHALAALQASEEHIRLSFDAAAIGMVMVSLAPPSAGRSCASTTPSASSSAAPRRA